LTLGLFALALRIRHGRVKPGHDALGQTPTYVTLFGGWYYRNIF